MSLIFIINDLQLIHKAKKNKVHKFIIKIWVEFQEIPNKLTAKVKERLATIIDEAMDSIDIETINYC